MRLVLFIEHSGDYECNCFTEVLPLEHLDANTASVELLDAIKQRAGLRKDYDDAMKAWYESGPSQPKYYNGKNKKACEKSERAASEFRLELAAHVARQPKVPPSVCDDIVYRGHSISTDVTEDGIRIITVDEWYSDAMACK